MDDVVKALKKQKFTGDIEESAEVRQFYSHDASLFEVVPELVVAPKSGKDVASLVQVVNELRSKNSRLSVTPRSAGTDMSGGAVGDSIVVDLNRHLQKIIDMSATHGRTQPGVFYRNFEKESFKHNALLPPYPASRELCTVGGMVANNSGGEKSLQFGKTEKFVNELKVVLADGKEYVMKPLHKKQLDQKMRQKTFEGRLYKQLYDLVDKNYEQIKKAKPNVSKDSTAYHIWNVWDRETGIFDITQAIIGSQGTLGLVTEIDFRLVPKPKHSGTLVVFLHDLNDLGEMINTILTHKPATFEGFDNYTLMLSFKLFYYFHQSLGWAGMLKLGLQLIPDALMLFRGIPKMVLLVEFNGETPEDVAQKVHTMRQDLKKYQHESLFEEDETEAKAKKFWIMRRESFNLLRKKVHDKHTAPFIDDLVVNPEHLPEFLPRLRKILNKYELLATVAGHMGDGNFHVIPLMKIEEDSERAKLRPAMKEVNELVLRYGGSLSGEHNDGMIRGPWIQQMYGTEMTKIFKELKHIFDPHNIFNPHKKTDADWDYSMRHIREHF
jgi:FAD/FMN-containing dehydrogenase